MLQEIVVLWFYTILGCKLDGTHISAPYGVFDLDLTKSIRSRIVGDTQKITLLRKCHKPNKNYERRRKSAIFSNAMRVDNERKNKCKKTIDKNKK